MPWRLARGFLPPPPSEPQPDSLESSFGRSTSRIFFGISETDSPLFWDKLFEWIGVGADWPIPRDVANLFDSAQRWVPRRDPLVLDLDNDGIETTGFSATSPILFDTDGDGIKTGTGWVKPDDGFLVLDRDGNGRIDDGRELFGDATPLNDAGSLEQRDGVASDGFEALTKEDTNRDGLVNSADGRWSSLRIWRDINQDGVSQASELFTLEGLGIAAIRTQSSLLNQNLENGNVLHKQGSFLRSNGTQGTAATVQEVSNLNLAEDTFSREFTTTVPVMPAVKMLPKLRGSGLVGRLWESASTGSASGETLRAATLTSISSASTLEEQGQKIGRLISEWGRTSGLLRMTERVSALGSATQSYGLSWVGIGTATPSTIGSSEAWDALVQKTADKIEALGL